MSKWEINLIDQAESVDDFRQYELGTYQPNGLNERDVTLF